ncbi:hypothetical protein TRFO_05304 [Tritrichomonas foetus]|uniref:Uncharacterized protein n=1 Tax=Tritrichomonas foetus TaxID=1144522 RepID=A0A1J4K7Z3_9EUKA|nr:hypothetical protein TRFO_05304 [Tritrichomonas foetus]|eukprot:OHT07090.1 hypothetical protein TRFO_05304 [Tritrichomonas foetus]
MSTLSESESDSISSESQYFISMEDEYSSKEEEQIYYISNSDIISYLNEDLDTLSPTISQKIDVSTISKHDFPDENTDISSLISEETTTFDISFSLFHEKEIDSASNPVSGEISHETSISNEIGKSSIILDGDTIFTSEEEDKVVTTTFLSSKEEDLSVEINTAPLRSEEIPEIITSYTFQEISSLHQTNDDNEEFLLSSTQESIFIPSSNEFGFFTQDAPNFISENTEISEIMDFLESSKMQNASPEISNQDETMKTSSNNDIITPECPTQIQILTPIPKPDQNVSYFVVYIQDQCSSFNSDLEKEKDTQSPKNSKTFCYTPTNVTEIDFGQINETIETIYIYLSTKLTPSQMIAFSGLNREKGENNGNNENIKNNKNSKNIKNNENNKNQENQESQESHDNQKKYKISIQGISSEISEMYVDLASNNNIYEMNFSSLSIIFVGNHIKSSVLNLGEDLILNKGNQNPKINISTVLETYFKHLRYYDYFIIDPNTEQTFNSGEYNIIEVHSNYILFNKSDSKEPYKYEARTNKPIRIESSEERIEFNVHKSDHFVILSLMNLIFSTKSEIIVNALKSVQGEKFGLEMNQQTVSLKYSSSNIPVTVFGSGRLVIETPNESTNVKSIKTTDISHSDHLNISNFSINNEFSLIIPENIKSVYTNSITAIGLHPSLDVHYLHKSNFLNKEDSKKNHIKIVVQNLIIEKDSRIQIINSISIEKKIDIFEGGLVSFSRIPEFSISVEIDIVYSHKYKQRSPIISFETFSQEESRYENITISKMNFIHGLFSTQNSEGETISDDELYLEKILIIPMKKEEISKLSFIDSRNKYSKTSENEFLVATLSSSKSNSSTTIIAVVVVIVIVVVIALIIIVVILIKKKKNRQSSDYQDEFDTESTSFSI